MRQDCTSGTVRQRRHRCRRVGLPTADQGGSRRPSRDHRLPTLPCEWPHCTCDWEAEKIMVIYRVVFESGRIGESENKMVATLTKREHALSKRSRNREQSTAEKKASANLKELRNAQVEQSNLRESRVRNQLIDKCMRTKGLSFVPTCDPQLSSAPDRSYYDSDPACWK